MCTGQVFKFQTEQCILAILVEKKFIKSLLEGKEAEALDQRFSNLAAHWNCLGVNGHIILHSINQTVWGHQYFFLISP